MSLFKKVYPDIKKIRDELNVSIRGRLLTLYPDVNVKVTASDVSIEELSPNGVEVRLNYKVALIPRDKKEETPS